VLSAKSEIRKKLHNCLLFNKNLLTGLRNTEKEGLAAQVCQSLFTFLLFYSITLLLFHAMQLVTPIAVAMADRIEIAV
jgi:hypothetical protein